jgi:uroporphyrinogen-III synthase
MNKPHPKELSLKEGPLTGLRVLVGRARHQASALSTGLREQGAAVLEIPFIEIQRSRNYKALDEALARLHQYHWMIFTSVNGVDAFWDRLDELNINRKELRRLKVAAIGPATKAAIERQAMKVDIVPKEYVAESVVESLRDQVNGKRILLARARVARDVIPLELAKLGATVDVAEVYETVIPRESRRELRVAFKNAKSRPDIITFTSSSSVKYFAALLAKDSSGRVDASRTDLQNIRLASIGPITSATLREAGLPVDIEAKQYTVPGLIAAIVAAVKSS